MAGAPSVDVALLAAAAAAREQEKLAKDERARAMDAIVDLLFERAALRYLVIDALDRAWMPQDIRRKMEVLISA
jgi:hypothetical protein